MRTKARPASSPATAPSSPTSTPPRPPTPSPTSSARRIDLTATETSVADLASAETGRRPADTETIARTTREWDGRIAGELIAEVH